MAEYIGSLKIIDGHELLDLVTHTPSPPKNKQIKTKETKKSRRKSYLNVHTWHKLFKKDEDVTW